MSSTIAQLSVIVCSHNPIPSYLERTLDGLSRQTLPKHLWDFVLIDNASRTPLTNCLGPLRSHPSARIVREDSIGLLNARITGFRATDAPLAVLVDDDNVLAPNYLEAALEISAKWPILGAWGGQCHPEFETPPEEWTQPYWGLIAIREFAFDRWSNHPIDPASSPLGAGMCIRRAVIDHYLANSLEHPLREFLGRRGTNLAGGEDTDICSTSTDLGLGTGVFACLELLHLIPSRRVTEDYFCSLINSQTFTAIIQKYLRGIHPPPRLSRSERLLELYQHFRKSTRDRRFAEAHGDARERARGVIEAYERGLLD